MVKFKAQLSTEYFPLISVAVKCHRCQTSAQTPSNFTHSRCRCPHLLEEDSHFQSMIYLIYFSLHQYKANRIQETPISLHQLCRESQAISLSILECTNEIHTQTKSIICFLQIPLKWKEILVGCHTLSEHALDLTGS